MKILDYIKRKCTRGFWHTYNFVTFKSKRTQKHGFAQYTIVSACYNVSLYLDDYFTSIVHQSLMFTNNIFIICVDDGSTDETAQIIKKWQNKYPNNIKYIYKEHGGKASARNLGTQYVKTPYVTFTDPDDFLDKQYFFYVDKFLKNNKNEDICMVCTPLILYYEDKNIYKNTHNLKHKFVKESILPVKKITNQVHLHMPSAIFNYRYITKSNITINEKIKHNFEDGNFIGHYLMKFSSSNIAYLKNAKYHQRKKKNAAKLDAEWTQKGKFYDVLLFGHLDLLKTSHEKYQELPEYMELEPIFIQNTILYDLILYVKLLVNNSEMLSFLSVDEKKRFMQLIKECFAYIDAKTILDFSLVEGRFYNKVGILHCFKDMTPDFQIVYVERYDPYKNEVLLRYVTGTEIQEDIYVDAQRITPTHRKISHDDFCGETFVLQYWIWVPLQCSPSSVLKIGLGGKLARLSLKSKQHKNGLLVQEIRDAFPQEQKIQNKYTDCWLVMDRNTEADDNGEFFYRYLMAEHPEVNAYFVLEKQAKDWMRLEKDGFRLLNFGSKEHKKALAGCQKIISSHIADYVVNYFKTNNLKIKQIIFLQHGVIKDDLSQWLNNKSHRIDIFVTSTKAEYASICGNGSRYKYGTKEVQLTGLPRHDTLWKRSLIHTPKKQILIQPTWRKYLVGKVICGNRREIASDFMQSEYAQKWKKFLCSEKLFLLARQFNYEIIFFPHPNTQPYLLQFDLPKHILTPLRENECMQDIFLNASLMITDYSSVAFDMAYLQKPVLYYQFDREIFFQGQHAYRQGYFDYEKDGFGSVCEQEEVLLDALEKLLKNECKPKSEYAKRMKDTFIYKDGKCCERIFKAIMQLDSI